MNDLTCSGDQSCQNSVSATGAASPSEPPFGADACGNVSGRHGAAIISATAEAESGALVVAPAVAAAAGGGGGALAPAEAEASVFRRLAPFAALALHPKQTNKQTD
jgi:hypothetical protein